MSRTTRFDTKHGENIKLSDSGNTASWSCVHFSGWTVCKSPLLPGDTVTVSAQGSGSFDIGYTLRDPTTLDTRSANSSWFVQMSTNRIHKRTSSIDLALNAHGTEVTITVSYESISTAYNLVYFL